MLVAVSVITPVKDAEFVLNAAVTPLGSPEAVSKTVPLNGLTSVIAMVSVAVLPGRICNVAGEGASAKLPAVFTVRPTLALEVSEPEVPVILIVELPATAELLAVNVSTLVPVVGLGEKAAVTPPGSPYNPDADKVTLPANPLISVTVILSVALLPCAIDRLVAEEAIVKFGVVATPHAEPLIAKEVGTALVTPFHRPLNPMPVRVPPAGTAPLYARLVSVTFAPVCISDAFQMEEIVCPLAKDHVKVQLVQAVVPVLLIVMAPPKAVAF